ncbi:MAG: XdhC family protein [Actinomycetia bacterium]|nr:XdhC family protein [Actinomycetes bacterium]
MTTNTPHQAHQDDIGCDMAHGLVPSPTGGRRLVAVFASPVAHQLIHFGAHVGFEVMIVDPDLERAAATNNCVTAFSMAKLDEATDVVVTDHDRAELGELLAQALRATTRWIGVMGSLRHTAPHIEALRERGFADAEIARVHRPIGLDIGSHSPGEIALSTVAGLLADRNGRSGGPFTTA